MRTRFFHYFVGCMLVAFISVPVIMAQTVTGSITGEVTDPSGAVVPNAKITAENVDTGVKTQATTNAAGVYSIRFLPIGHYKVVVAAEGFSSETVPPFTLEINQTVKLNEALSVGATSVIEVDSSSAPILNTTDGTLGITVSTNEIASLPLNGRNFSSITLFQPGAVTSSPQGFAGTNAVERNTLTSGIASINGNRTQANNYTLDGIDMNEGQNNLIAYTPAPDALGEVKVISANAPATYGNVNGGDVVSVLKSGTNQFHGSAYAYLQNQTLNANSWSNNFKGIPINPYTQTQFGGTIGGPIWKNKLFFFADYEGVREHTGGSGSASVLTDAMRGGDFSALESLTDASGKPAPVQLYDTQNNFTPYKNDQGIPVLNPVAQYLFAHPELYPHANRTPTDSIAQNDFVGPQRSFKVNNQGDAKIEWDPNSADKITGFYSQSNAFDGTVAVLAITFPSQNVFPTKLFGATWVHVLSPEIVNQARIGFTRVRWDDNIPTDPTGVFGLNGNSIVGIPFGVQQYVGFSFQNFGQDLNSNGGIGTPAAPQILRDNTFSYEDNLTWQRGKHLLSMGVQAVRYQQNYLVQSSQGALGQFNYDGSFTGLATAGGLTNGYSGADFILDRVQNEQIQLPGALVGNRQWRAAAFFQDDWKVTGRLTLNLGLRYEYDQPWTEVNNKTANVLLNSGTVEYAKQVPVGAPAGSIVCDNPACYQPNYAQIMPRIGFAYQVSPSFVVRGGYGATSFFEGNSNNQRLTYNAPFVQFSQLTAAPPSQGNGGTPLAAAQGFAVNANSLTNVGFGAWPQNIKPAYINEFNLTTEFAINSKTSLTIGYVGETGQHIEDYRNANQLTTTQAASIAALPPGTPLPVADVAPFAGLVGQGNPLLLTESEAMMNYNALQASLRQRASKGFEYTINYTYARAMTNSAGNYAGLIDVNTQDGAFQNGYDGHADYGPAPQDVRHNLSAIGVYAIPYGRGMSYGGNANRALDLLLGGWSISGTAIAYSGFPISIFGPRSDGTNTFGDSRANQFRKLHLHGRTVANWWGNDPSAIPCTGADNGSCAYGPEAPFTFGTAAVGTERAPGFDQIDTSVFKNFRITEGQSVGFRADAFNVFNFASYDNPDNNIGDSNFGQITGTRSLPRQIQLALHYNF